MELDTYVHEVQAQLVASAALGDDGVRRTAATLASAASSAVRLAVLSAVAAAGDEITAALLDSPGAPAVAVRLDADEIRIAVMTTVAEPTQPLRTDENGGSARISLRLSEGLKAEIDGAAARAGVSVNTWLVRAATTALESTSGDPGGSAGAQDRRAGNAHHITGWING
jgi:hypothetical protein